MYAIGINIAPVCYIKHGLSKYDVELHCIVQRARDDYLQTIDEVIKTLKQDTLIHYSRVVIVI